MLALRAFLCSFPYLILLGCTSQLSDDWKNEEDRIIPVKKYDHYYLG